MNRGKFIRFLLILNFSFIVGNKDANLRKLQQTTNRTSFNSTNFEYPEIPLPKSYIFGFSNYEFHENPYMIKYDILIRLANYSSYEVENITMKVDIISSRLRFLEEEEVTCIKITEMQYEIYRFICSKEVSGSILQISYIDNSIKLNSKIPLNSSISEIAKNYGENIQKQTNNSFSSPYLEIIFFTNCSVYGENNELILEGETYWSSIEPIDSILSFVQDEDIKNIKCIFKNEKDNRFKMICNPEFNIDANLSNNNAVYMEEYDITGMMFFEEGKYAAFLQIDESSICRNCIFSSSERISKSLIFVIIFLFILLLAIIIIIVFLCKSKSDSKPTNQKNDKNPPTSEKNNSLPSSDTSKEKTSSQNTTLGLGENITNV